jgi:conjugative transposon TraM protein
MKIDFKKQKYVIPLIILPFTFLLFYAYKSFSRGESIQEAESKEGLQMDIAGVSNDVKSKDIGGKLDAFKDTYKDGDGYTAISSIEMDNKENAKITGSYNDREKYVLDSINNAFKTKYGQENTSHARGGYTGKNAMPQPLLAYENRSRNNDMSKEDKDLANALSSLQKVKSSGQSDAQPKEKYQDPMALFRDQMAIIDSMGKANDPDYKAKKKKEELLNKIDNEVAKIPKLDVAKAENVNSAFNTVQVEKKDDFIKAIIDQTITGSAGSRLRIRLLEDIKAGKHLIKKGTYIYALISGFQEQRVKLTVTSIMTDNKILPVKLELYDLDGMQGLYVPASAFREFTKELTDMGQIQMQSDPSSANQLYMSAIQKLFTSTSTAVSKLIRQNKAKMKYGTFVYLIDPDELKEQQKNY